MATLYPDIKTKNWQISTVGVGFIAEGLADIRQCLDLLLRTQKGSDPLRPEFGCDIFQYVDKPLNYSIPNIIRSIIEAVQIWETRVTIKSIRYEIEVSHVRFYIICSLVDEELIDLILLYQNGGFVIAGTDTGSLTLYALFPPNPNGKRYNIQFIGDDEVVLPETPINGFATISSLYDWVAANWGGYASWQLGADRITAFVNGVFSTGSLTMSLVGSLRFEAPIPNLNVGEDYSLTFIPDGSAPLIAPPASFSSIAEMLNWVQTNWQQYGTWSVEGNPYGPGDFDIQDFNSDDFDVGSPAQYILILDSETVNTCVLQVNIV